MTLLVSTHALNATYKHVDICYSFSKWRGMQITGVTFLL